MKGEYAMPIKIPNNLPVVDILAKENIFVMDERSGIVTRYSTFKVYNNKSYAYKN